VESVADLAGVGVVEIVEDREGLLSGRPGAERLPGPASSGRL